MFQGSLKGVLRKFKEYLKKFKRCFMVLQGYFKEVSKKLKVSRVFQESLKGVQESFKRVSRKIKGYFKEVFSGVQGYLKEVQREFQGLFKFQGSFTDD